MKQEYKAVLFALEGDYKTDFHSEDKRSVYQELDNLGSKWIFYPIQTIAKGDKIVEEFIDCPKLQGMTILQASKYIRKHARVEPQEVIEEKIVID